MAGNGLKWNGIITVPGIWGVLDLKIRGLDIEVFLFGSGNTRSPGLVFGFCFKEIKKSITFTTVLIQSKEAARLISNPI